MIDSSEAQVLQRVADAMRDEADELPLTSQLRGEFLEWADALSAGATKYASTPVDPAAGLRLIQGGAA